MSSHMLQSVSAVACALLLGVAMSLPARAAVTHHTRAQSLVEAMLNQHTMLTEVGISTREAHGCRSIASTDPGDVGESCESGDLRVMHTHKLHAVRERDGIDLSVPLHDAQGKPIGVLDMETNRSVRSLSRATQIALGIEKQLSKQIPSRASLDAPG